MSAVQPRSSRGNRESSISIGGPSTPMRSAKPSRLPSISDGGAHRAASPTGSKNSSDPAVTQSLPEPNESSVEIKVVPNEHFVRPQPLPKMPWEMNIPDRRKVSKDPRIRKQVLDEEQWASTPVSGLWKRIALVALPENDWKMDVEQFRTLLISAGITGEHLQARLITTFDPSKEGVYHALVICKVFLITLTDERYQETLIRHCFDRFDRPASSDGILTEDLNKWKLVNPEAKPEKKSKGKAKAAATGGAAGSAPKGASPKKKEKLPLTLMSGATFGMVEGLRVGIREGTIELASDSVVSYEDFKKAMLDEANGEWIGHFLINFFECCASMYTPPTGSLPLVPLRWLVTTEPVPPAEEMYDADTMLLREIQKLGEDPFVADKKKKKKPPAGDSKK